MCSVMCKGVIMSSVSAISSIQNLTPMGAAKNIVADPIEEKIKRREIINRNEEKRKKFIEEFSKKKLEDITFKDVASLLFMELVTLPPYEIASHATSAQSLNYLA